MNVMRPSGWSWFTNTRLLFGTEPSETGGLPSAIDLHQEALGLDLLHLAHAGVVVAQQQEQEAAVRHHR